jgi:hypothetical protein
MPVEVNFETVPAEFQMEIYLQCDVALRNTYNTDLRNTFINTIYLPGE